MSESSGRSAYYLQFVEAIDSSDQEVSAWEAQFIEHMLESRPQRLSDKQCDIIRRMAKQYLGEDVV